MTDLQARAEAAADAVAWTCFHCGETFTDRSCAARHFGMDESKTPACLIKGADGGLLWALRDAEIEADRAIQMMHDESTDAAKAYHAQRCRHTQALIAAEEVGYERGLRDGRALQSEGWRPASGARECPLSALPSGKHQVDTSMESGPNNCFFCEEPMPLPAPPEGEGI